MSDPFTVSLSRTIDRIVRESGSLRFTVVLTSADDDNGVHGVIVEVTRDRISLRPVDLQGAGYYELALMPQSDDRLTAFMFDGPAEAAIAQDFSKRPLPKFLKEAL